MLLLFLRRGSGSSCVAYPGARYVPLVETLTYFSNAVCIGKPSKARTHSAVVTGLSWDMCECHFLKQAEISACASRMAWLTCRCSPSRRLRGCHGRGAHSSGWRARERCGRRRMRHSRQQRCAFFTANAGKASSKLRIACRLLCVTPSCKVCHASLPVYAAGQNHSCLPGCRSSALLEGLGWSQPLAGSIVAAQLLALGRMHAAGGGASVTAATAEPASCKGADIGPDAANGAAHGPPAASTAVSQMLAQLIPQLYRALDALPVDEFKAAAAVVSGAAVVWVGNGFTETDRVALRCRMKLMPCNSAEARGGCAFYRRA